MKGLEEFKVHLEATGYRPATIEKYLYYIQKLTDLSQASVDRVISKHNHTVCKAALIKYVRDYHKKYDIIIKFIKEINKGKVKRKGLTVEEYYKFHAELNERDQLLADLYIETGFRMSEILGDKYDKEKGLKPKHVEYDVIIQVIDQVTKEEKEWIATIINSKVKGGRWEPAIISDKLRDRLKDYISTQQVGGNETVFNISGDRWWQVCNEASMRAGIRHVHPHLLKHTTAKRGFDKGLSTGEVADTLHHASKRTTEQHYDHHNKYVAWRRLREP